MTAGSLPTDLHMRAEWVVPADHPAFAGHFPGHPVVPGVVLLDYALLLAGQWLQAAHWSIAQAKFLWPVGPSEALVFTLTETRTGLWALQVRNASRLVASGVLRQEGQMP